VKRQHRQDHRQPGSGAQWAGMRQPLEGSLYRVVDGGAVAGGAR
jgi:hypothetical protein